MARRINVLPGTAALWRLDENPVGPALDVGPNGVTLANVGPTSVAVSGMPFTRARAFASASAQYLEVAYNSLLHPAGNLHVGAWVKLSSLPASGVAFPILGTYYTGGAGYLLQILESGGSIYLYFGTGAGWTNLQVDITAQIDTVNWFHVAGTRLADGTRRVFLNGVVQGEDTGSLSYNNSRFTVGNWFNEGGTGRSTDYFDGLIADVFVGAEQGDWIPHNVFNALTDPQLGLKPTLRTFACYNFDQDAGTVVDDTTNHDGTEVGAVPVVSPGPISTKYRDFPGTNGNYLNIPHHADFNRGEQPKTIEMWFTPGSVGAIQTLLYKESAPFGAFPFWVRLNDLGQIVAYVRDDNARTVWTETGEVVKLYVPNHLVFVWNPYYKQLTLVLNGFAYQSPRTQVSEILVVENINTNVGDVFVGAYPSGGGIEPFDGHIHSLRFNYEERALHQLKASVDGGRVRLGAPS